LIPILETHGTHLRRDGIAIVLLKTEN
jgi:hypothetical protein